MWNIWSVFRSQLSAQGAAKWNLANLLHFSARWWNPSIFTELWKGEQQRTMGTNLHTLSALLQRGPFMLLSYRWIYLAYIDLLVGLEVPPPQSLPPLKVLSSVNGEEKRRMVCSSLKALTCAATSTVTVSPQWPWHGNSAYCSCWTGAEWKLRARDGT